MNDWISTPSSDGDFEGIYKYLSWHLAKAGMSSNCFHYLEVLYKQAQNTRASDEVIRGLVEALETMMEAVRGGWQKHELEGDWEQSEKALAQARKYLGEK